MKHYTKRDHARLAMRAAHRVPIAKRKRQVINTCLRHLR